MRKRAKHPCKPPKVHDLMHVYPQVGYKWQCSKCKRRWVVTNVWYGYYDSSDGFIYDEETLHDVEWTEDE